MLASVMDEQADGSPSRWAMVDYYDYDKSATSIARYFRPGGPGNLMTIAPGDWPSLARKMQASEQRARKGEIGALVFDGLSAWYRDDLGLEAAANPEAIDAGGNAALKTRVPSANRLGAIVAMLNKISAVAARPDFLTLITVHTKEQGDMSTRELVPDMPRNQWAFLFRVGEVVLQLSRTGNGPPRVTYKDALHEHHRVKNPDALKYFDAIHANRDEAKIAKMRTVPGLVGLLEHVEAKAAAAAAATISNDKQQQTTENTK